MDSVTLYVHALFSHLVLTLSYILFNPDSCEKLPQNF